ncbi:MAG: PD40 domain-containing protein [Flavobacteriales bacterium]|nr:PD40 domain-containing protein [Flavobacteriales bacterium]
MKKIALIITFTLALVSLNAQEETFRQSFLEANTLMEENQYNVALPIWLKLQAEQPANFNVNYKVGVCYIHSANDKRKALDYLVKAVQNTTKNYDPFSSSEKKSPIESYFYLARAYHINYELDNGMLNYNSFKQKISKKHYLFNEVDHHIEQCKNAKIAVANPVNIKVSNMGRLINSAAGDYSPVLSVDESTIYFTSRRIRKDSSNYYIKDVSDGKHYEDIYVSYNYDGVWTEPELLGINTEGHEATVNISTDGQTLFIYKDDNGDGNIYVSEQEDGEWSIPKKLGSDINLESRETHAHISPDGNFLYFVSDRKKGMGGQDIYMCKKLPNGEWAKAQNLGDVINTPYDEDGVFIHPDGKTMYFSSKGHSSIGGFDIFYSIKDDAGNWSKPVNMGYPVNSTEDDVFFVTSADGKRGYYSSFQDKGYGEKDIYKISLEDADAKPLTLLTAFIRIAGQEGFPSDALITVTNNETDERERIYKPRKKDGKFSIILEPGNDYHIVYTAAGFTQEEDLYIPPISAYQEINRGIDLDDVIFGNPEDTIVNNTTNNSTANNNNSSTSNNNTTTNTNTSNNNTNTEPNPEVEKLKEMVEALKKEVEALKKELEKKAVAVAVDTTNNSPYNDIENPTNVTTELGEVSYAQYFKYNKNKLDREHPDYKKMISEAALKCKTTRRLVIEISSSASKVPSKTFKTNEALARKRGYDAKRDITTSLLEKGVSINAILFKEISTSVNGPDYGFGKIQNTDVYEKYQYVIIKIK